MRYVVGGMMVILVLVGVGLIWQALKSLFLVRARLPHLVRTEGIIERFEYKRSQTSGSRSNLRKSQVSKFPVIRFRTLAGESITFRSEMGELVDSMDFLEHDDSSTTSKYKINQPIRVLYDPEKQIPPMIDDKWAIWGPSFFMAIAGIAFIGGGALIFFAFGDRIFGQVPGV